SPLMVGPGWNRPQAVELSVLRHAIRDEQRLSIRYRDERGRHSERTIWPLAIGFFESTRIVVAWCELRETFRHFRADRIQAAQGLDGRYPRRRHALLKDWRASLLPETVSRAPYT